MKTLVLAEKPSVARDYARVLNCRLKRNGYLEGDLYVVTWALGHLVTLAQPGDYRDGWKEWQLKDLPMMPDKVKLKVIKQTSKQFRAVKDLLKRTDVSELIIATDAGREGELVARWIMKLAGWRKPSRRLWISSQTDQAIKQGFSALRPSQITDNLFHAAECRAEADWLVGLNVTRALTCKFDTKLSAGRVQTPTLALIVIREQEIKDFVPKNFWTLEADFGDFKGIWRNVKGEEKIFNQESAQKQLERLKGKKARIESIIRKNKTEPAPLAYDLTALQRDANRFYSFPAKKTLSILQKLYEFHKVVTYPRTDSRYITSDMLPTIPLRLKAIDIGPYSHMVKPLLTKTINPGKRMINDAKVTDHHAIIPTEEPLRPSMLTEEERKIFDLIARRFIALLSPSFQYMDITVVTAIDSNRFYTRGKITILSGWKQVVKRRPPDESSEIELPEIQLGKQLEGAAKTVKNLSLKQAKTKPPPRYTEATLLGAMENPGRFIHNQELRDSIKAGGLGTPATRADIIEKLFDNFYAERRGRELLPTSRGSQLVDLVPPLLRSAELTAKWEVRLSNIAAGKEKVAVFISDIKESTRALVGSIKAGEGTFRLDNLTKHKCPMCGQPMLQVQGKKEKMLVCSDRKCGFQSVENTRDGQQFKRNKRESQQNRQLIARFSDHKKSTGISLGDFLEKKIGKKQEK